MTANDQGPLTLDQVLGEYDADSGVVDVEEPSQQLVLFRLGGQRFALPGSAVKEIISHDQPVYFVPGLPASTEGVLHLRGHIESVILPHVLLGLEPKASASGMILLVAAAGIRSGVRIEQLDDVCDVPQSLLKAPPETLSETLRPFVSALWQPEEGAAAVLLDPEALFNAYQQGLG
ncbi:chemotaxis protein CheW [Halomonas aquamarina]|uniref:Chemotaxis protein CheW n=1 Tax=Vreelandella aquamarina TaxID=77097 RepID=A0ACC5VX97_9GAMM|nr:chemotaxis protein CheW [Halomonas aquamarina]MBZ5488490.1 chemotaxis protein CheW [Halomonas aquamarina]